MKIDVRNYDFYESYNTKKYKLLRERYTLLIKVVKKISYNPLFWQHNSNKHHPHKQIH